jgi:hypothetical protein
MIRSPALAGLTLVVTCMVGCSTSVPVTTCSLDACGAAPNPGTNVVCDFAVDCDSLVCLAYQLDGDATRAPFCSEECIPDPTCSDPFDPATCNDPRSSCPTGWTCTVVAAPVVPGEPSNCQVSPGGTPTDARCLCVPCCVIDPTTCADPASCG